jgi:uncharacterized RDD family membrane protein YckC
MDEIYLHNQPAAGFLRRLMAAVYDWLLVIALMMVGSVPLVIVRGDAIDPGHAGYRLAMLTISLFFFAAFWSRGGQTPGMKTWRIRLTRRDGESVRPGRAVLRYFCAALSLLPAGLGFVWLTWDKDGLSWHDRWSDTTLTMTPPRKG